MSSILHDTFNCSAATTANHRVGIIAQRAHNPKTQCIKVSLICAALLSEHDVKEILDIESNI